MRDLNRKKGTNALSIFIPLVAIVSVAVYVIFLLYNVYGFFQ